MKIFRTTAIAISLFLAWAAVAPAQTWTSLKHQPTVAADTALLLTDGTVMMHQYNSSNWWRLTPDNTGSYVNGTWSQLASMQSGYAPLYFASAVLADGNVIVEGGEYNNLSQDETNMGSYYNSSTNKWTAVNPPSGWPEIGDSPGIVLANGTFMIGRNETSTQAALLNEKTLTWTATGSGKADPYSEEGWVLLPDKAVLTTDGRNAPNAEKYDYLNGTWISAGSTIVRLEDPSSQEIGPMVLRPDGTVFATGGNASGAGHTSIYTSPANPLQPGTWTPGPDMPGNNDMADAPAAILPDGNVLCDMSPGIFNTPVSFYEFDGTQFISVPNPPNTGQNTSYVGRMLVLPTGQVMFLSSDGATKNIALYNASGTYNPSWAPTITKLSSTTLVHGKTYIAEGTQFNGLSNGAAYGDDAQMNSNYPLVRITNTATGHVFYAKTHNHSTMGVGTGSKLVGTGFDVPASIETGASTLEVVANGIPSTPVDVTVQ
jgi:hypothetical protein